MTRLPDTAHTGHDWRIHDIAPDFEIEDVWALPTPGGPDDFPRLLELMTRTSAEASGSPVVRALFAIRWKVGGLLGWDGERDDSLRDRLPADLLEGPPPPRPQGFPFKPLYVTDTEYAAEIANETMHGVMHLSWVPDGDAYRGQMAVLVKRNGLFGSLYMAAIAPFRHLIVYPTMLRDLGRRWPKVSGAR